MERRDYAVVVTVSLIAFCLYFKPGKIVLSDYQIRVTVVWKQNR